MRPFACSWVIYFKRQPEEALRLTSVTTIKCCHSVSNSDIQLTHKLFYRHFSIMSARITSSATSDNSSSRSASGAFSQSSSEEYDNAPWDAFLDSIQELTTEKLFSSAPRQFISVSDQGGSFYRVARDGWNSRSYLVHFPCYPDFDVNCSAAVLQFLEGRSLPVPELGAFDNAGDNTVYSACTIQTLSTW